MMGTVQNRKYPRWENFQSLNFQNLELFIIEIVQAVNFPGFVFFRAGIFQGRRFLVGNLSRMGMVRV